MKQLLACYLFLQAVSCNAQTQKVKYTYKAAVIDSSNIGALFYSNAPWIQQKVDAIFNAMTTDERAAQMIMIASGETMGFPYQTYVKPLIDDKKVANVIFLKGTTTQFKKQADYLNTKTMAGLSPLYACDCEPSLLHYKMTDKPKMTTTNRLQDSLSVKNSVDSINNIMDLIGIHVNFAPVLDIGINKAVISNRAFSAKPDSIVYLSDKFIHYTQTDKKAATIKHFPGHGAVSGDTHKQSVYIDGKLTELATFQKVITQSNPIFVMIGHITVRNNPDGYNTESGKIASSSRTIVTKLLKQKMGFNGIVTTDAMNMGAATKIANGDWEAIKAGVDLILMPVEPRKLHAQIVKELTAQSELAKEMELSIKKIIRLKYLSGNL